jgi:uncharacterized cupin superfamily protein
MHHISYVLSGRLHLRMDDGRELDLGDGDARELDPGTTRGWSARSPA